QVPDVVPVHQMPHVLDRVGGGAGDELLHRHKLGYLDVDAIRAVLGDGAHHVAFREHADRGIALGADDVLDHQRADVVCAHQLRGNTHRFVHTHGHDARRLLAQNVSDQHCNLPGVNYLSIVWYTLCQSSSDGFGASEK